MRIAIVSDVFPPKCGGAGWSAYYLARAMAERGHVVRVVVPKESDGWQTRTRTYGDLPITEFGYTPRKGPFIANYSRNEELYPRFAAFLARFFADERIDVAHAQHYLSGPPTVLAAHERRIGSVVTVRDYWPICYWTTLLRGPNEVCPGHNAGNLLRCLNNHIADADTHAPQTPHILAKRAAGALATPAAIYMERNLRRKRHALADAGAVVAVSRYVADALAPYVPAARTHVIPNFVDLAAVDDALRGDTGETTPYLFFAGKLEPNKGATMLVDLLRRTRAALPAAQPLPPLLVAGEGTLRARIAADAGGAGLAVRFLDWLDNATTLRLMAGAEAVLFPSLWPEPLSRVLLEASAAGALVAALDTGGTPDVIADGITGVLAQSVPELAAKLAAALTDPPQARRLREGARRNAEQNFSQAVVAGRFEALYATVAQA